MTAAGHRVVRLQANERKQTELEGLGLGRDRCDLIVGLHSGDGRAPRVFGHHLADGRRCPFGTHEAERLGGSPAHAGRGVGQERGQRGLGRSIADEAECEGSHRAHVGIGVRQRGHEQRHASLGLDAPDRERGATAHAGVAVAYEHREVG